tara:strand:+ start:1111 stop:4398 length:3288 start_codon:yes stop_codon:yes gene_type:complete
MPITPISTPYTAEYKPLGLEAFAAPLSKMQEKFDVAQTEIEGTKYALSRMSQDDERAKKLLLDLEGKTSELSQNLSRSGNYKQATKQLKNLNEYFNSSPELAAIKSNYNKYQENYKIMQSRINKDGTFTEKDFDLWDYNARNNFKGTNYDKSTGTYTTGDFSPKGFNLEKEVNDEVKSIAAMSPSDRILAIQNLNPNIDGNEIRQQLTEVRTKADVSRAIRNFVLTGDRYKNWKQEEAQMEFFMKNDQTKKATLQGLTENKDPLSFSKEIITDTLPDLERIYGEATEMLKEENLSDEDRATAEEVQKETGDQINLLNNALEENDEAVLEQEAGGMYIADAMGYFDRIALAGADIVDFIKEGAITMSGGNGAANKKVEEAQAIKNISTSISKVNSTGDAALGDTAPFMAQEIEDLEPIEYTVESVGLDGEVYQKTLLIEPAGTIGEMYQKNINLNGTYADGVSNNSVSYAKTNDAVLTIQNQNESLSKNTLGFAEMYDTHISEQNDNIKKFQVDLLNSNLSESEKAELDSKIKASRFEAYQSTMAKVGTFKDLDYLIVENLRDKSDDELLVYVKDALTDFNTELKLTDEQILEGITELKELFSDNTLASPQFLDAALNSLQTNSREESNVMLKNLEKQEITLNQNSAQLFLNKNYEELNEEELLTLQGYLDARIDQQEPGYDDLPDEVKEERQALFEQQNELEEKIDAQLEIGDNSFNAGELVINKIFNDFRKTKTLGSEQFYQVPAITMNESADLFSGGQFKTLVTDMVETNNQANRVIWDPISRRSIAIEPGTTQNSYNLDIYRTDQPQYVGDNQYGNPIYAFTRKTDFTEANMNVAAWKKYTSTGGFGVLSEKQLENISTAEAEAAEGNYNNYTFSPKDLKKIQEDNPEILYLSGEGFNMKPSKAVTENFVSYIEAASSISNTDNRIDYIEKQRANYAPFYMASSAKVSAAYYDWANTLQHRALNGIESSMTQGPASQGVVSAPFEDSEGRVVTREYEAQYQTKLNEIIVQYTEILRNAESGKIVGEYELPSVNISNQVNLPTALAKLDLTFGTGSASNLKYTAKGGKQLPLVLANLTPDAYRDNRRMQNIIK